MHTISFEAQPFHGNSLSVSTFFYHLQVVRLPLHDTFQILQILLQILNLGIVEYLRLFRSLVPKSAGDPHNQPSQLIRPMRLPSPRRIPSRCPLSHAQDLPASQAHTATLSAEPTAASLDATSARLILNTLPGLLFPADFLDRHTHHSLRYARTNRLQAFAKLGLRALELLEGGRQVLEFVVELLLHLTELLNGQG